MREGTLKRDRLRMKRERPRDAVVEVVLQSSANHRKGKFLPGDLRLSEQLNLERLISCSKIKIQQFRSVKEVDLGDVRQVEQRVEALKIDPGTASSNVSRRAPCSVVSPFSRKPAGSVQ